jgi:hypothetical protein
MTPDDLAALEVELQQDFELTLAQIADLAKLPEEQRAPIVADWRALGKLSWTVIPSKMARFESILNILAAIASPITVIVGGVSGVAGVITAFKGI